MCLKLSGCSWWRALWRIWFYFCIASGHSFTFLWHPVLFVKDRNY